MNFRLTIVSLMSAAAVLGIAAPGSAAVNLIVNGSFEAGDFTGFTHTGTAGLADPAVVLNYNSAASYGQGGGAYGEAVPFDNSVSASPDVVGLHAAYFVADYANNESISQLTALHSGNYRIGFSAYLPQNGANNGFDATFAGSIIGVDVASFTASQVGATQWYNFSGVAQIVTSGNYLTSFTFNSFGAPAKDFVIDRVFVIATNDEATYLIPPTPTSAIPEPAVWSLMIAGFGMTGFSMRRSFARTA